MNRVLKDKQCPVCDTIFRPKSSLSKFCSYPCATKGRVKKGKIKLCPCGKEVYSSPSQVNKYCSRECASKAQIKSKPKKCTVCKVEYSRPPSQELHRGMSKYCSVKCKGVAQKARYQAARSETTKYPKKLSSFKKWTWKAFSDYIRERDNWTCFTCGKYATGSAMHAGHFVSRVRSATMFDERNVHAQCYACNIHKKGNGAEYAVRIIERYGADVLDELVVKSRQTHKFTYEELEQIYQSSKSRLKDLTKNQ